MPNLQKLDLQQQIVVLTTPFFVPATENPELESAMQSKQICEYFVKQFRNIRYKLSSPDTSQKIQFIGKKYGFELLRLANITRLIREYYFGEVRFDDFPKEIEKRMSVSPLTAQEIARYIKQEILDWDPWAEYIAKLPKMPIRSILQQYPRIGDTDITSGYIGVRNSDDMENPTIKNWLHDYVLHLGQEQHSQMQRTEYLFHSENGMNLNSPDRAKLGIILKSFDDNLSLPVDEENQEIVFEAIISEQPATPISPSPVNIEQTQSIPSRQESFIRPFATSPQPQRTTTPTTGRPPMPTVQPISMPARPASPQAASNSIQAPVLPPAPSAPAHHLISQNHFPQPQISSSPEIDKFFSTPELPVDPSVKIHSISEGNIPPAHNNIASSVGQNMPQQKQTAQRPTSPQPAAPPKHRIIDPFSRFQAEPRLNGNIVDLSGEGQ